MKLIILGSQRSGKDIVAKELGRLLDIKYIPTSLIIAEILFLKLNEVDAGYSNSKMAYEKRHHHREKWFKVIKEYNKRNAAKLAKEVFKRCDMYVGCRDYREYMAMKDMGITIWVQKIPHTKDEFFNIQHKSRFITLINSGGLVNLGLQIADIASYLKELQLREQS